MPANEHGRADVLAAEPGVVADLRPGEREPGPARLRRDQPEPARAGGASVELELPAGGLPGDPDRRPQGPDRQPAEPPGRPRSAATSARRLEAAQRTASPAT